MLKLKMKKALGFTLLEVVIAMAIGVSGVIAFAGLQLKSVEITEETRERATAAYLAAEMMERMMMNSQDAQAKAYYRGETGGYWNTKYTMTEFYPYEYCGSGSTACNTQRDRARYDIYEMKRITAGLLPNGDMRYRACGPGSNFDCIVVSWEDANPATCGFAADGSGLEDCYILQSLVWF